MVLVAYWIHLLLVWRMRSAWRSTNEHCWRTLWLMTMYRHLNPINGGHTIKWCIQLHRWNANITFREIYQQWWLLVFGLHECHPTVTHMPVHLQNGERVHYKQNSLWQWVMSWYFNQHCCTQKCHDSRCWISLQSNGSIACRVYL